MLAYTDIFSNIRYFRDYSDARGVQLVLASKTIDQGTLQQVYRDFADIVFAENRVQELCDKYFAGPHWYFIGRLQRNKVKYLVDKVEMICSVDSVELAREIERQCAKHDKVMPVLVEVNDGEEQKGGVSPQGLYALLDAIATMPHLALRGLMVVLPIEGAPRAAKAMHEVYVEAQRHYPALGILSMGMSADYQLAVDCGADMIRIGSAVFGERSYHGEDR